MKRTLFLVLLLISPTIFGQNEALKLSNALVIGRFDKSEDRYTIENNFTELLVAAGIKANPSLNFLRAGSELSLLATDSMQAVLAAKGYDTYAVVSIRGYDRTFKKSKRQDDLKTCLEAGNLFSVFREEITSVTFEIFFYRKGKFIGAQLLKCKGVSSRDTVIKKFRKMVGKVIDDWK
jgi:hypothetical protein